MRFRRYLCLVLLAATAVLAFGAAGASSGSTAAAKPQVATASKGKVGVKYTIKKFVRRGNRLVAYGAATPRYISTSGAVTKGRATSFKAAVVTRTRHLAAKPGGTVCPVLDLVLGPLDLNLLGAMVHLDQVHLTITADPNGGLLGNLLCNLSKQGKLAAQTQKMNWVVKKSGLSTGGAGVVVNVHAQDSGDGNGTTPNAISPLAICDVLDLTLGPIHLDLLGLVVDTNTIHLTITADSEGGILGSLLCSLAGGAPAPAPTP
jgi:hypothetical protein